MTVEPEHLYGLNPAPPEDPLVRAINRLAQAIEQGVLTNMETPRAAAPLAALPPVRVAPMAAAACPIHNQPWKTVPAGVSKRTGNAYEAFAACPVKGCDQRP